MRVFIVGTGRCGSVTFAKACEHLTNFTVEHERVFRQRDKLDWPDDHIAVEPSLWPLVPLLRQRYPTMLLVHLMRMDRAAFIESYRTLDSPAFIGAKDYRIPESERPPEKANWEGAPPVIDVWTACHVGRPIDEDERRRFIGLYYDTVNAARRECRPSVTVRLEHAKEDWPEFLDRIHAEGNLAASLAEWYTKHNSRDQRTQT